MDVIAADASLWDIKQVSVTWNTDSQTVEMKIYTNYGPAGEAGAGQGDIALTPGNSSTPWGYGIIMAGVTLGADGTFTTSLVPVTQWLTTTQVTTWNGGGFYYAGAYGDSAPGNPIDSLIAGHSASLATVSGSYTQLTNDISTYLIDLVFNLATPN